MKKTYNNNLPSYEIHEIYGNPTTLQIKSGLRIMAILNSKADENSFENCPWRYFEFYSLSHLLSGHGRFVVKGGKECDVNAGDAVLMTPGVVHRYGGFGKEYHEENILFYGPAADFMRESGVIIPGVYKMGKLPCLNVINDFFHNPDTASQLNANFELQKLLMDLYNSGWKKEPDMIDLVMEKIRSSKSHWWTVEELAEMCSLSCDQFRRNFFKRTGLLPKTYIEHAKMNMAAGMIVNAEERLTDIAALLGYQDFFHFSRRFKKFHGVSPSEYRKRLNII